MATDTDVYDLFVSYARADDAGGWISGFIRALQHEHRRYTGGRDLAVFFDREEIRGLDDWEHRIRHALATSRLFVAFVSPRYFSRPWCRREWSAWIDHEIAKHVLSDGVAAVYVVEVPGLESGSSEQDVARQVAALCAVAEPRGAFVEDVAPVVRQMRKRQLTHVGPFYTEGVEALRRADLHETLAKLARDLGERAAAVARAAQSPTTVPPYNRMFTGRVDDLQTLRQHLLDDRSGVITGIHGLGGVGKTELAFTYAHAFAGAYPGGRFLVPCDGKQTLREAMLVLGSLFREQITEEERKDPERFYEAVIACLRERARTRGHVLLVLDNVTVSDLLSTAATRRVTCIGPEVHLLATTRLPRPVHGRWMTLGELSETDSLELLEKHRAFASEEEREAGRRIVRRLGGFALAVELVAAWLRARGTVTCAGFLERLGLEDLEALDDVARDATLDLRHQARRVGAVLRPTLDSLSLIERRAMEYAAFLHADQVPLPWLRALVAADFPELAEPTPAGHEAVWDGALRSLRNLALFSRAEHESSEPRVVRTHRIVQDVTRNGLSDGARADRQASVERHVRERERNLSSTTGWANVRWEIEPLDALAHRWWDESLPGRSWLMNQIAIQWFKAAEWTRAEPMMAQALALEEADRPSHPETAVRMSNLGQLYIETVRFREAEHLLRRALGIDRAALGDQHPQVAQDMSNLATVLHDTGQLAEAELLLRHALAVEEATSGPSHSRVANVLSNLAAILADTSRLQEAEPLLRRALKIRESAYGGRGPDVAQSLSNLAEILLNTERLAEAETFVRRAIEMEEATFGENHPRVGINLSRLGGIAAASGRLEEAESLARRALDIAESAYGGGHPQVAVALSNLALLIAQRNDSASSVELLKRAVRIDEDSIGPESTAVAFDLFNLAGVLCQSGSFSEAESLLRRVLTIHLIHKLANGVRDTNAEAALGTYCGLLMQMGTTEDGMKSRLLEIRDAAEARHRTARAPGPTAAP